MTFLLDECILGKTEKFLKEMGFSILSVKELGKASAENGEILNLAKSQDAILVTNDLDFANLTLYPPGTHTGIIVLRMRSEIPETIDAVHEVLKRCLKETDSSILGKGLVVIDHNKYRIRSFEPKP